MQQRSEEWYKARLGIPTASRIADIMATTKTGDSASYKNYMMQLLCERLTGDIEKTYQTEAMLRGIEKEELAKAAYEFRNDVFIDDIGFIKHKSINMGASPDGIVLDGLVEIKCPNTAQHVEFLKTKKIPQKYIWQMMCQMECTGKDWCDFVSFDDRLPESLQFSCLRVHRDAQMIEQMNSKVIKFNEELDELLHSLQSLGE